MKLIVQKFGGSSISNVRKIVNVAKIITNVYDSQTNVLVVVSAQGDTTDWLINKMFSVNPKPSKREMDVLMSVGEQISIALLTSYINSFGVPAVSLTGWQAGIYTDDVYGNARIKHIDNRRILRELNERKIVIVAGFQGVDEENNITTLGRGGSDTSAVALAVSLKADVCQIYTDVDGVYTADPRLVKKAKKIEEITFDEMLEMSSLGAKILHNRSVELAKNHNLELDVRSSFSHIPGTRVKEEVNVERGAVRGIACDDSISLIKIKQYEDDIYDTISILEKNNIVVSAISINKISQNENEISLVVPKDRISDVKLLLDFKQYVIKDHVTKVSIIGAGLMSNPMVLSRLFKVLSENNIKQHLILTGEITISIIVDSNEAVNIMNELHDEYNLFR